MGFSESMARGAAILAQLEQPAMAAAPVARDVADAAAASAMSGALSGLDDGLADLYFATSGQAGAMAVHLAHSLTLGMAAAALSDDGRYVAIDASVSAGADAATLLAQLQSLGLKGGASFAGMVSGELPVAALGQVSGLSALGQAHASMSVSDAGSVESQGVEAERVDLVQTAHPDITGAGVRLGILSTSFDTDPTAATREADDLRSGDLPADTRVLAENPNAANDEGRAMAQLAHDAAPGAGIDFATAEGGQAAFAANIIKLAQAGDKVIVDDIRYPMELSYQNGPIAQAIETVVRDYGVTYFSSDTNDSNHGWEGAWANGARFAQNGMTYTSLAFAPGQDYLPITLPNAKETAAFSLQWDEPGASAGGPGATSDLDVFVYKDAALTQLAGMMTADQKGGDPVANFSFTSDDAGPQTFYVRVGYNETRGGGAPPEVRLVSVSDGADMTVGSTPSDINHGAVLGHKVGGGAIGVGAASYKQTPAFDPSDPQAHLEPFSGVGFDKVTWSDSGTRLTTPIVSTPQIVGVDGVATTFFGLIDPSTGLHSFTGTSAAAPDVAAVAVLMLQANGALTRDDVLALIKDSALDMDNPHTLGVFDTGFDRATGAGLVQADLAVNFALGGAISNASQTALTGTHFNDVIVVANSGTLVQGGAGADSITSGTGHDLLLGQLGDDRITVAAGSQGAGVYGGQGDDVIDASASNAANYLSGDLGDDTIRSGAGFETVMGGQGDDSIIGGSTAGAGSLQLLFGDQGADHISYAGAGSVQIFGGQDADTLSVTTSGQGQPHYLFGNLGDDTLTASGGYNLLYGGQGNDLLRTDGPAGSNLLSGDLGSDTLVSSAGGGDTLRGGGGGDLLLMTAHGSAPGDVVAIGAGESTAAPGAGESDLDRLVGFDFASDHVTLAGHAAGTSANVTTYTGATTYFSESAAFSAAYLYAYGDGTSAHPMHVGATEYLAVSEGYEGANAVYLFTADHTAVAFLNIAAGSFQATAIAAG